jgi:hypothetical protein
MADVKSKFILITPDVRKEINLIAAIVRAKGSAIFMEDFFKACIANSAKMPDVKNYIDAGHKDCVACNNRVDADVLAELRILAVKECMSTKAYMEAVYNWLAKEHKKNGRVWIDDTEVSKLPIRRR